MAGRPSERIKWDGLGNEADEGASEMNYEYEWVVPDHDEDMEQSPRHRRGGRLGLAGRGRAVGVGRGRGSAGHTGHGGGSARRSQLAQCVRSAVNQAMTNDANENGGVGDSVEHVEEQHADNNVQGDGNGGASGVNGTLIRKRRWYQLHEKHVVYAMVLERTEAGVLSRGVSKEVSELTSIPQLTVQNWWKQCKEAGGIHALENKRAKNCGRKGIEFDPEDVKQVDLRKRTTLKDLANELHMAKTTLWRCLKEGLLRRHTNAIKSTLTDENKVGRVRFCLSMFDEHTIPEEPTFESQTKFESRRSRNIRMKPCP
ncbi:Transposon protein, putative, Mariner sub-class [Hordeum vulgare]|nr:Transposon protein, putative, Mariner sub-class [Hordeum vulgare]